MQSKDGLLRDVKLYIFSFVERRRDWASCVRVCREFYELCMIARDPSLDKNRLLAWLSAKGDLTRVKKLIEDPRVIAAGNLGHALIRAVGAGHLEIVRLLVTVSGQGANTRYTGLSLLSFAFGKRQSQIALELLRDPKITLDEIKIHGSIHALEDNDSSLPFVGGGVCYKHSCFQVHVGCGQGNIFPQELRSGRAPRETSLQKSLRMSRKPASRRGDAQMQMDGRSEFGACTSSLCELWQHEIFLPRTLGLAARHGQLGPVNRLLGDNRFNGPKALKNALFEAADAGQYDTCSALLSHQRKVSDQLDIRHFEKDAYVKDARITLLILENIENGIEKHLPAFAIKACIGKQYGCARELMRDPRFTAEPEQVSILESLLK